MSHIFCLPPGASHICPGVLAYLYACGLRYHRSFDTLLNRSGTHASAPEWIIQQHQPRRRGCLLEVYCVMLTASSSSARCLEYHLSTKVHDKRYRLRDPTYTRHLLPNLSSLRFLHNLVLMFHGCRRCTYNDRYESTSSRFLDSRDTALSGNKSSSEEALKYGLDCESG